MAGGRPAGRRCPGNGRPEKASSAQAAAHRPKNRPVGPAPPTTAHHAVMAASPHACGLLFAAVGRITIAGVSSRERKWRQPGLAAGGPKLIGRHQLVGSIQRAEIHFDLVRSATEDGRSTARAEVTPPIVSGLAIDRHGLLGKNRGRVKERAMMLAAIEAVAEADPVWSPRCHKPDTAAQATAGESVHAAPPPRSACRIGRNEAHLRCRRPPKARERRASVTGKPARRPRSGGAYQMALAHQAYRSVRR